MKERWEKDFPSELLALSVAAEEECYKGLFITAIILLGVHSVLGSWKRWSFGMFSAL